jgi:hypothetical protein
MATLEEAIAVASSNNRVCPQPQKWNQLFELLPGKKRVGLGWEPPLPLILAAWDAPALLKVARLREHLEWAADHGTLESVQAFMCSMSESDWHHFGE